MLAATGDSANPTRGSTEDPLLLHMVQTLPLEDRVQTTNGDVERTGTVTGLATVSMTTPSSIVPVPESSPYSPEQSSEVTKERKTGESPDSHFPCLLPEPVWTNLVLCFPSILFFHLISAPTAISPEC